MNHWSRMKADGMEFCQEELPPTKLAQSVKDKLGLSYDKCKKLEYCGATMTTRHYLWEFGLASWRKKYDYDIQYLQRRFPSANVKNLVCSLVSHWNFETSNKKLPRKYIEGRDIPQLYLYLSSKAKVDVGSATESSVEPRDFHERSTLDLAYADEASNFKSDSSTLRTRYLSPKHMDKPVSSTSNLSWETVTLDIQHMDHTESRLAALPFVFICRSVSIMPGEIRVDIIKEELQKQGVDTDEFSLRLQGSQEDFSWELRDLCLVLTIWRRNRSEYELDVPLLLVPRILPDINVSTSREENVLLRSINHFLTDMDKPTYGVETKAQQLAEDDHATSPQFQTPDSETILVSIEDQVPGRNKRSRGESSSREQSDDQRSCTTRSESMDIDNDNDDDDDQSTIFHTHPRSFKSLRRGRSGAQRW